MFFLPKKFIFADVIELERHIEILLLNNDCVIVPDFGGFMAHHVEARYDEDEQIFLPPKRTLGFNPQLTLNDSLLAQSYIEAYDISYPEAVRRIADEVAELKQHLESEGEYTLNDVGVLRVNSYGKYEFEPCEAGILSPELYGLSSFEMHLLPARQTVTVPTEPVVAVEEPAVEEPKKGVPPASIFLDNDDDDRTIHVRVSVVRNVAVACIAILLFLLIPSPVSNGDSTLLHESSIDTGMLSRILPTTVTQGKPDARKLAAVSKPDANTTVKDTVKTVPTPPFTVVLCSKVTSRNAKSYVKDLQRRGYTEAFVAPQGRLARVLYGHYNTEREAYRVVNKLNNTEEFQDCWVMKVKKS